MCYDVLVMTCGGVDPSTKNLAEILKAQPVKEDYKTPGKAASKVLTDAEQATAQTTAPDANSSPAVEAKPAVAELNVAQNNNFPPNVNQNFSMPPGYLYPPGMAMPINPVMGFPMSAYTPPPAMPIPANVPMQVPIYPPNIHPTNAGFPNQAMPPAAWQYVSSAGGTDLYGQPNMPSQQIHLLRVA